jgi:regulator of RNase E activity RraA
MKKYDVEKFKKELYSGILSDVMDGMGYRNQAISNKMMPLQDDTVVFGPAFTSIGSEVYSMPEDPLTAQCKIVDQLSEGEVYVLATRGKYNCAVFGELFATAVNSKKGAGVLLDGWARDLKALHEMDFPLFYRGRDIRTSKGRCEINECQIPITIDGVVIKPGDIIFGDIDGVAVVPAEIADEVFEKAMKTIEDENVVRDSLRNGVSLTEAYKINGAI